jgi:hypothetical protein
MLGRWAAAALAICTLAGGAVLEKERAMSQIPRGENRAIYQGEHDLDSDLCWQSIQAESSTPANADAAHAACMREKGWAE